MLEHNRRIFVFGWDAAGWDIISRLIKQGYLPNLNRLIKEGVSTRLIAEEPILSPCVWTTIASGKRKEKHGILDFNVTAQHVRCKRIWDILEENGKTIGLFEHFVTWPAGKINGFIIPDLLAADHQTYPPELSFLKKVLDTESPEGGNFLTRTAGIIRGMRYGITPKNILQALCFLAGKTLHLRDSLQNTLRQANLGVLFRFNFFMHLYRRYRPDFAFFHAHNIDNAAHHCWRYIEPEKYPGTPDAEIRKYGNAVDDAYRLLDNLLGKFLRRWGDEATCVVISDHGIGSGDGKVYPTQLKLKEKRLLELAGADDKYRWIDRGFNVVYLRPVDTECGQMSQHVETIKEIRFKDDNAPLFDVRMEGKSIFLIEKFNTMNPQDVMDKTVVINGKDYPLNEIIEERLLQTSGWHHPEGIFIIRGQGIRKGVTLQNLEQTVITPTLLHAFGIPAGKDMDGKIVEDVFETEYLKKNPPGYIETWEKGGSPEGDMEGTELTEEVKRKLRDLGYFS